MSTVSGLYTEVFVSSAQTRTLFSSPVDILSALPTGQYYDIDKMIIEYSGGSIGYDTADKTIFISWNPDYATFASFDTTLFYTANVNRVITLNGSSVGYSSLIPDVSVGWQKPKVGGSLFMWTAGADSTTGNGTFKFKIWYNTRIFG